MAGRQRLQRVKLLPQSSYTLCGNKASTAGADGRAEKQRQAVEDAPKFILHLCSKTELGSRGKSVAGEIYFGRELWDRD